MKLIKNLRICTLVLLLGACSTNAVHIGYDATKANPTLGKALIVLGNSTDEREKDANWLGAIRGGFGNPIKTLTTEQPVSEVVKTALGDGLKANGLLTKGNGKYRLDTVISRFDCSQYVRLEAHIELNVSLVNVVTKEPIYTKHYKADHVTGNMVTLNAGVFGSVDDLRKVANDTLQDAIDQIVTDPALLAKLH